MKTKSRNLIISFLLVIAMLFSVFAITSLTASAVSTTPDPTKLPAETIYVGGVALNAGQYVKNGETTATTGQPAEDTSGFAWHTPDGTLLLVDYTYTGKGYEYSSGNYALIYSTGTLHIALGGENTLKQTQSHNMGIYTVGALQIGNVGSLAIEGDNCSCLYSNNEIIFAGNLGTVNLKTTGNVTAIVSYDNDEDALDEEAIIVNGGDIYVETFYPISDLTINYGALTVSSPQYPLSEVPDISNYNGNYTLTVSENEDGSNPKTYNQDTITTFDIDKITDYKYLRLAPPPKTAINSISVSGADLPEVGETKDAMEFTPDSLTYGGEYKMVGRGFQKYTGTEWVEVSDTESLEYGVKYRVNLVLAPNEGYAFANSITSDDVTFNGEAGIFETLISGVGYASIFYEFSYEAPATDYGITIADKDDSGETIGVLITEENCADVLGDGTVSYNPTTNTLTLNGYKYEGEGFLSGSDYYYGICVTEFFDDLTVVLAGENVITLTKPVSRMMRDPYYTGIELWNGNMTIKGDGSLAISSPGDGICVYGGEDGRGVLEIEGGSITIEGDEDGIYTDNSFKMTGGSLTVGATYGIDTFVFEMNGGSITVNAVADYAPGAICAYESFLMNGGTITASATGEIAYTIYLEGDFTMNGGSLKLSADCDGIILWEDSAIVVSGGTLEISTKEAGHAFIRVTESDGAVSIVPTVTGDYSMTASVNEDGSGAVIYDEDAHETYKYVKIAFVTDYGIKIADTNDSGETIGVLITEENYTDVLGDGTVSYDPETKTLTLNGYIYAGAGFDEDVAGAIFIDVPDDGMTINLMGENKISVASTFGADFGMFGEGNVTVKGSGSLEIQVGMYGFMMMSGALIVDGGNITIKTTGTPSAGLAVNNFIMNSGNLKIDSVFIGIVTMNSASEIIINGGSLEIGVLSEGNTVAYATGEMLFESKAPDLSNYDGAYKMIAGANTDGTGTTDYSASDIATYKYIKLEPLHTHAPGADIKSDASNHWNECTCGEKLNIAPHVDENGDGKCDTCDFTMQSVSTDTNTDTSTDTSTDTNTNTDTNTDTNTNAGIGTPPSEQNEPKGLGTGAIVGITVGSIAVAGIGGFSLIWFVIKKKTLADLIAVFKK